MIGRKQDIFRRSIQQVFLMTIPDVFGSTIHDVSMSIHARLRTAREAKGLTPSAVAERMGITVGAVHQHENGSRSPSADSMLKYARIYGASLDWLMRGIGAGPTGESTIVFEPTPSAQPVLPGRRALDLLTKHSKK
jgi:transcriptional regulator with XRE-family HTH domain